MTSSPSTPSTMTSSGLAGQTFLVGEHVYVRAVEASDMQRGTSWKSGLFPHSTEWYDTWYKEGIAKESRSMTYVVVRKADDVPVGSVVTVRYEPVTMVSWWVDPLLGERGQQWLAEAFSLVIPWLSVEQHRPALEIDVPADQMLVAEAIEAAGGRLMVRNRQQLKTWGGRVDGLVYEVLNPQWLDRLGDPNAIELVRTGTGEPRPVPPSVAVEGYPPANAIKVGARVYLRPLEKADAATVALWSRRDNDTVWDAGRWLHTSPGMSYRLQETQKSTPQEHPRFGVCLRETDELIGSMGLAGVNYFHGYAETESEIFRPEYRGSGYGSEAKHLMIEMAFTTLNLHSLQSKVIFPNPRSAAALRKQGYREAGRLHWNFASFGTFENFVCLDLLASDWLQLPRAAWSATEEERGS